MTAHPWLPRAIVTLVSSFLRTGGQSAGGGAICQAPQISPKTFDETFRP